MSVGIIKAFKNMCSDNTFLQKYTVLVVLSFCAGLFYFAYISKNTPYIYPTLFIAIMSYIISVGYDLFYIRDLLENEEAKLPEWKCFGDISNLGLRFTTGILLFGLAFISLMVFLYVSGAILGGILSVAAGTKIVGYSIILFVSLLVVAIEIFMIVSAIAFICEFLNNGNSICTFFKWNKVFKYFNRNYFLALFAIIMMSSFNAIIAACTTISLKYILLYIIPLMLAPIIRLGADNLIAQHIHSSISEDKSVIPRLIVYILASLLFLVISAFIYFKTGMLNQY